MTYHVAHQYAPPKNVCQHVYATRYSPPRLLRAATFVQHGVVCLFIATFVTHDVTRTLYRRMTCDGNSDIDGATITRANIADDARHDADKESPIRDDDERAGSRRVRTPAMTAERRCRAK